MGYALSAVDSGDDDQREREFCIDNLLVRVHFIIVMIRWTGLAPWEFEFPFPGSLTSTFPELIFACGQVRYALSAVDFDHDEQICFREFLFAAVHCVVIHRLDGRRKSCKWTGNRVDGRK